MNLIYLLTLTLASLSAASPAAETGAAAAAGTGDSGAQPPAPTSTGSSSSSSDSDSSSPYQQCAKKYTFLPLSPNKPHIYTPTDDTNTDNNGIVSSTRASPK